MLIMQQSLDDTNNQQERLVDVAWLAGFWEGEGTFSIVQGGKGRMFPRGSIINCDFKLIDKAVNILKENNVGHYVQLRMNGGTGNLKHSHAKIIYVYGAKRTQALISLLRPFLYGRKSEVADRVAEYITRRLQVGKARYSQVDKKLVEEVRTLNRKGPQESSETIRQPLEMLREDIVQVA